MSTSQTILKKDSKQLFISALTRQGIGIASANKLLDTLKTRYSLPTRYYHTIEHANEVASHAMTQRQLATHSDVLLLAAWFHDVIYWPTAHIDNELASARFARHSLYLAGCTVNFSNLVGDLIMCTQHGNSRPDSVDGQILADADLVSLAAARPQHIINLQNIRKEYRHVPLLKFCEGHRQVMLKFQQRERIFWTDQMADRYEVAARANIDWVVNCINQECLDLFTQ